MVAGANIQHEPTEWYTTANSNSKPADSLEVYMPDQTRTSRDQIIDLARSVGLSVDEARAETIAARLGAALDELDEISDNLAEVEPAPTFTVEDGPA